MQNLTIFSILLLISIITQIYLKITLKSFLEMFAYLYKHLVDIWPNLNKYRVSPQKMHRLTSVKSSCPNLMQKKAEKAMVSQISKNG